MLFSLLRTATVPLSGVYTPEEVHVFLPLATLRLVAPVEQGNAEQFRAVAAAAQGWSLQSLVGTTLVSPLRTASCRTESARRP